MEVGLGSDSVQEVENRPGTSLGRFMSKSEQRRGKLSAGLDVRVNGHSCST